MQAAQAYSVIDESNSIFWNGWKRISVLRRTFLVYWSIKYNFGNPIQRYFSYNNFSLNFNILLSTFIPKIYNGKLNFEKEP